ncbi:hypothetical protein FM114_00080 [Luteococcus japonicus LSP_Lj1]|uniref:Uncharacterized protein n=1 Tax=Luteococcus japonicus LSP_Lj1 TaxID=1255658 RepID=A0A1R4I6E5_9ACTN|nr:hypothetical protein FM114_00080 [Luteococcus japonicus LSP_Lj1]
MRAFGVEDVTGGFGHCKAPAKAVLPARRLGPGGRSAASGWTANAGRGRRVRLPHP